MAVYLYGGLCIGVYGYVGLCRSVYLYVWLCMAMWDYLGLRTLLLLTNGEPLYNAYSIR